MQFESIRASRIANDYKEMIKLLESPNITWELIKGDSPYVEEYLITLKIHTYKSKDEIMDSCKIRITLPDQYPKIAPIATMLEPRIFHPNWYPSGRYDCGRFMPTESLGCFVIRMIRTIQFEDEVINPHSSSNTEAAKWYLENQDNGIFPTDNIDLPVLRNEQIKQKITITRENNSL